MIDPALQVQIDMITEEMQHALNLCAARKYDLALHHITQVVDKIEALKTTAPVEDDDAPATNDKQITLEIEPS